MPTTPLLPINYNMLEAFRRIHQSQNTHEGCEKKGWRITKADKQKGDEGVRQWCEKVRKRCDHVKEADGILAETKSLRCF